MAPRDLSDSGLPQNFHLKKTKCGICKAQHNSVQSPSRVWLFALQAAARQASLSITNSRSLLKLMSIKQVMPSNHLILCPPLLLLPSILPSIRVFSNKSALHIQARILEWVAMPFSRRSSRPRDWTGVSFVSYKAQANSLPLAPPGGCGL